jgi:hypothetical protein
MEAQARGGQKLFVDLRIQRFPGYGTVFKGGKIKL